MLAEALIELGEQGTVVDLSVANQRSHLSTLAISRLLDAMEACPEMIKLGLGTLRDDGIRKRHQQITMANTEAKRIRRSSLRRSAAGGEDDATGLAPNTPWSPMSHSSSSAASSNPSSEPGSPNRPLRVKSNASSALLERMSSIEGSVAAAIDEMNTVAVDWAHEARCIAQSEAHPEPALVGARELPNAAAAAGGGGGSGGGGAAYYSLSGSMAWLKATDDERRGVIEALATNTTIATLNLANCNISDGLGAAFGDVLRANSTLTCLNLETNALSSAAIESIARSLQDGGGARLRELKLANQRVTCSQRSEEALAEALWACTTLVKLSFNSYRSTRARDLVSRGLARNVEAERSHRQRRKTEAAVSAGEATTSPTSSARQSSVASPVCRRVQRL